MKVNEYSLGFIGFGHMAKIICRAIDRSKLVPRSQISFVQRDTVKMKANEQKFGVTSTTLETMIDQSQLLLLCVRPDQAEFVLRDLARLNIGADKMVISIMAGIKMAFLQKYLGHQIQILRVMPNIASAIGEGMSVFSYSHQASLEFRSLTHLLFSSMGEVIEVTEDLMDISCALVGSCPGFVFKLIESIARTGERRGLPYAKALKMTAQAFTGAARLILRGTLPETLIEHIATPSGTTDAGFKVMAQTNVLEAMQQVIEAAAKRSKEISEEFY